MTIENIFLEELRRVISERPRGYQTEIANALKINTSTFSNMVCGRRGWEEDERRAVAKFVGLDYDHIATGATATTHGNRSHNIIGAPGSTQTVSESTFSEGPPLPATNNDMTTEQGIALKLMLKYWNTQLVQSCLSRLKQIDEELG